MYIDLYKSPGQEGKTCRTCEWCHSFEFSEYPSCLNKKAKEFHNFVLLSHGCEFHTENKKKGFLAKFFK